jgi:Cu/Ag efflux protein CusF
MRLHVALPLGLAIALAATSPASAQTAPPMGGVVEAGYTMLTATVVRVDLKTREVELRDEKGKTFSITVNEAVKNLDQVRPGDVVNATLTESVAYEVKRPGQASPGTVVKPGETRLEPGEKPKGVTGKSTTKTVTVAALDLKAPSVTFKDSKGELQTMAVKDPSRLTGVKVGDLVELTYTEATAFSVEKAPGK